jgi:hypothetical protein
MRVMKGVVGLANRSGLHQNMAATYAMKQSSILNMEFIKGYTRAFSAVTPSNDKNVVKTPVVSSDSLPDTVVVTDEELQEEWKALERRVSNRKPRNSDKDGRSGRSKRNSSAWDAGNSYDEN